MGQLDLAGDVADGVHVLHGGAHMVVHLDKATVSGRIKKDDVSASQWFDRFTLAQIQGFIDLANENKATNVLALLLEYKEKTFPDFDPMDEFTLEW